AFAASSKSRGAPRQARRAAVAYGSMKGTDKGAPGMSRHSRRDLFKAGGIVAGGAVAAGLLVEPALALTGTVAQASPWDHVPVILARIVPPTFPSATFDVTSYGAKGDGKTDDSAAFTKAIAACNKAGGGHVVVPAGKSFRTGAITLLSNVDLHVLGTIKF